MADYTTNKQSDLLWTGCSKILATPADATHLVKRIPARTFVWGVAVNKTTAYTSEESIVTIGFQGNGETADTSAFMSTAVFAPTSLGVVSTLQGVVLNSGGKYFSQGGIITVTSDDGGGTAGTFQVFVFYTQITN